MRREGEMEVHHRPTDQWSKRDERGIAAYGDEDALDARGAFVVVAFTRRQGDSGKHGGEGGYYGGWVKVKDGLCGRGES